MYFIENNQGIGIAGKVGNWVIKQTTGGRVLKVNIPGVARPLLGDLVRKGRLPDLARAKQRHAVELAQPGIQYSKGFSRNHPCILAA